jgi:UDP-N-acetylmuramoyl-tripeptide--D-alanyl-D-alanine ligase
MNKQRLQTYLQKILRRLAIWTLKKYKPGVIAVTGSVGKTSTKEAIYAVLKHSRRARRSGGNFNNELGMPLTILGDWQEISGKYFWIRVILTAIGQLIWSFKNYPEILILEYAVDRPGDMKYLLDIARPQIGVVTAIGDIPVHVEFFSGPEAIAREKSKVVEVLPATGFAVLNHDDQAVLEMRQRTRAYVITYGFANDAEVQITNFENWMDGQRPAGVYFKLNYAGSFVPVRLSGCFGKAQAYAAAAAACIGLVFGLNLVKISEALADYQSPPRRFNLIAGIKNTLILDDSYNASPLSTHAAIETVKELKATRKIAILGDMLEIGKYAPEAHEAVGKIAGKVFDLLFTVGPRAKFIAEAAGEAGMVKRNIYSFDTAEEAKMKVQELIRKGDLVLVKGSNAMQLDKIVEEIRII